jgi:hypothetical protein
MTTDRFPSPERIEAIGSTLEDLDLAIDPDASRVRDDAARLARDYLAPRLQDREGAAVVVFAGPGGSGVSTIVNSLARRPLSPVSDRRPTTLEPTVWSGDGLPATFDAVRSRLPGHVVDTVRRPPSGLEVVESPPPTVVDDDGVPVVHSLLDHADALLLVVSAERYADAAAFALAERAGRRRLPVAVVVNRLPSTVADQIVDDLVRKMEERGLLDRGGAGQGRVIPLPEVAELGRSGLLPSESVAPVWDLLEGWSREPPIEATIRGSIGALEHSLTRLRQALPEVEVRRSRLGSLVDSCYRQEVDAFMAAVESGRFAEAGLPAVRPTLVAAIVRHAGRAAQCASSLWEETPSLPALGRGYHAADDRVAGWADAAVDAWLAAGSSRRRPGRRRRRLRVAVTMGGGSTRRRPLRRRGAVRRADEAGRARRLLEDLVSGVLSRDAQRFHALLGTPSPPGTLETLEVDR